MIRKHPLIREQSLIRKHRLGLAALTASLLLTTIAQAFPKPSPYPIAWELKLEIGVPHRFVVADKAYWFITYTVTNNSGQERTFLPAWEVLTPDGKVVRTDRLIPLPVVNEARKQAGGKLLEQANQIAGDLRLGEDQTRDGIAIWPETSPADREFTLFFSGFSGEAKKVSDDAGKEITLFKTLQLDYAVPGDPKFRQINEVQEVARSFVMR